MCSEWGECKHILWTCRFAEKGYGKKTSAQDIVPLSAVKEKPDVPSVAKSETAAVPIRKPVHEKERVILRKEGIEIVLPPDISESMILLLLRGLKEC